MCSYGNLRFFADRCRQGSQKEHFRGRFFNF
jgi:hypothetical protein